MPSLGYRKGPARGPHILRGTISITPPSLTTGLITTSTITIAGAKSTDIVVLEPPDTLEAGIVPRGVTATNGGAKINWYNPTAGTVTGAAKTWSYKIYRSV